MSLTNVRTLVAAVFIAVVVVGGHLLPGLDNSRVENGIRNSLHLLVFAVFAVILYRGLRRSHSFSGSVKPVVVTLLVVALVGGLSEFVQYLSGHRPDVYDVVRDLTGAALALVSTVLWQRSRGTEHSTAVRPGGRIAAVLVGACIVAPLAFWLSIVAMGRIASPVILDFGEWWQPYLYRPINAGIEVPAGAAEVQLLEWRRSGLIVSPLTTNWVDYEFLTIRAGMLKGAETNVTIRINDGARVNEWSDAFMEAIVVVPGMATARIPLRELAEETGHAAMDLADIQEIVIFARDRRKDTVLRIEEIRLD